MPLQTYLLRPTQDGRGWRPSAHLRWPGCWRAASGHTSLNRGTCVLPMPAGFEAMNPDIAVTGGILEGRDEREGPWAGTWFEHQNLRAERADAFTSLLWEGVHTYTYEAGGLDEGDPSLLSHLWPVTALSASTRSVRVHTSGGRGLAMYQPVTYTEWRTLFQEASARTRSGRVPVWQRSSRLVLPQGSGPGQEAQPRSSQYPGRSCMRTGGRVPYPQRVLGEHSEHGGKRDSQACPLRVLPRHPHRATMPASPT